MPCVACTYMPNASWRRRGGKAQGRGISHPEQSGGRAKRRSAQAKRGRLRETLAPRQGSALSEVWFPHKCALAHRIYQGRVAAGTGRCGGKWRMRSSRSAGGDPSRKSKRHGIRDACGESQDCQLQGDGRRCKWDGYAPSWGLETPLIRVTSRGVMQGFPTTLCVGVLWTYVQAPKLKVHGAAYQRLSNSPTSCLWAYLRGAPQLLPPKPHRRSMLNPLILYALLHSAVLRQKGNMRS
jgi:hypothetical protein